MPQFAAPINAEKMKTQVNLDLMRDRQTDSLTNSTKEISSSEIRSSRSRRTKRISSTGYIDSWTCLPIVSALSYREQYSIRGVKLCKTTSSQGWRKLRNLSKPIVHLISPLSINFPSKERRRSWNSLVCRTPTASSPLSNFPQNVIP